VQRAAEHQQLAAAYTRPRISNALHRPIISISEPARGQAAAITAASSVRVRPCRLDLRCSLVLQFPIGDGPCLIPKLAAAARGAITGPRVEIWVAAWRVLVEKKMIFRIFRFSVLVYRVYSAPAVLRPVKTFSED
jgi:hypothetical protein